MSTQRKRLMVSAYACEPGKGSEIGVGWHWVLELSVAFEVWVITRANNRRPIEEWLSAHPDSRRSLHFVYFDLSESALRRKKGRKGVHRYYLAWTRGSDDLIRRTMQEHEIPNFMHLTYGNVLWPVSDFGSRTNFIWGPVGGLEAVGREYTSRYHWRDRIIEAIRRIAVSAVPYTVGFRRRCRRASLIICKTAVTQNGIPASCRDRSLVFTDVAADTDLAPDHTDLTGHYGPLRLLCVGRLDAWRGFDLAVEALGMARERGADCVLDILGKGPDRSRIGQIVATLGLGNHVKLRGEVPMDLYRRYVAQSDIILNPSLKEGAVTLSFDAMAAGKPLIALDTTGYTRNFTDDCAVIIPVGDRAATVSRLADAIVSLCDDTVRGRMGRNAAARASRLSWSSYGDEIREIISTILK